MDLYQLILLGIALGTDAFSVAVVLALKDISLKKALRLSLFVGLLHFSLLIIGIFLAKSLNNLFSSYYFLETLNTITTFVGSLVLILLGLVMIYEGFKEDREELKKLIDYSLFLLAISVSVDALSVGFGLGMLTAGSILNSLVLGIIVSILVLTGFIIGDKLGIITGERAVIIGGVILIFLALHLIIS